MLKLFSGWVPWLYSTIGRAPVQRASVPTGVISAPDAEVASPAPPVVLYCSKRTSTLQIGSPDSASRVRSRVAPLHITSFRAAAVSARVRVGGLCSRVPVARGASGPAGVPPGPAVPVPPPPQPASKTATAAAAAASRWG